MVGKKEKREAFKDICYDKEPKVFDKQWINGSSGFGYNRQKNICRYCKKEIKEEDFCITHSYWSAYWFPCHKECKEVGEKKEEYECQKIDSACNDCGYFERDLEKSGKIILRGICKKTRENVETCRNFCENRDCFIHRLDLKK
jgi:hypothetical protein